MFGPRTKSRRRINLAVFAFVILLVSVPMLSAGASRSATSGAIKPLGSPEFGVPVHFDYSTDGKIPGNTKLNISVNCYQQGVWKWQFVDWADQASNPGMGWLLGGPGSSWATDDGHTSSCRADLFYYSFSGKTAKLVTLASTTFTVACAKTDVSCMD